MTPAGSKNLAYVVCIVVASFAVAGYFTGLQSPMNPSFRSSAGLSNESASSERTLGNVSLGDRQIIPATHYEEIGSTNRRRNEKWLTSLTDLKDTTDLNQAIEITEQQKLFALALRDQNRSFNGAPPTIPHPVDQMSSTSCMACHGGGAKTETLRISKMSHQFLANCTQCHVESSPQHMAAVVFRQNTFVGLPAPTGGPRAFSGAPPMIPHSTWMRVDCMSCHGTTGMYGIRSTHPWRQNCQQCHAPSSQLDQTLLEPEPKFLDSPRVIGAEENSSEILNKLKEGS